MQGRRFLEVFKLDSIRNKILLFAVLAALVPSGITAWISYSQNRRALEARINQELVSSSSQTSREIDVWLKERFQELRTLGSSYEVTETVDPSRRATVAAHARLNEYLRSVRGRLLEYAELMVVDGQGRTVATTARGIRPVPLPADWVRVLRTDNQLVGKAYWDSASRAGQLILAVPITRLNGQILGALVTRVQLMGVEQQLGDLASGTETRLYIIDGDGTLIASSTGRSAELMNSKLRPEALGRLKRAESSRATYLDVNGEQAVGSARHIGRFPWYAVSEVSANTAFREVRRFRNLAVSIIFGLLVAVGAIAYWLGLILIRPLTRLTKGASEVAAGDLAVDLPTGGGGEVGYLTYVFNHMVARLRENRKELDASNATLRRQNEELERLSTTDGLTGLANRRQLSQRLNDAVARARRNKQAFAVLMADVDNFKSYNDSHGHPAGDEVLKRVAKLIGESIRDVDCAARYGGEEFCVLLTETSADKAIQVAERIRGHVAEEKFPGRHITLSIGIAEFPKNGEAPESVVAAADAALYQAKRGGRDRVIKSK